jgi:hypothetical protein
MVCLNARLGIRSQLKRLAMNSWNDQDEASEAGQIYNTFIDFSGRKIPISRRFLRGND